MVCIFRCFTHNQHLQTSGGTYQEQWRYYPAKINLVSLIFPFISSKYIIKLNSDSGNELFINNRLQSDFFLLINFTKLHIYLIDDGNRKSIYLKNFY